MCRWLSYCGPPLRLNNLLFKPENSLINQSFSARRGAIPINGDGFGLGWYGNQPYPGIFRDILPAWNDANLQSLSQQIKSSLFFAHVRASTGTSISRENCHPFRLGQRMFMHNGQIGGYLAIRRELEQMIPDEFYKYRTGTTDSELFFLLAHAKDLESDVKKALSKTVVSVLEVMQNSGTDEPLRITAVITNGKQVFALRYSSDKNSPTLFYRTGGKITVNEGRVVFGNGSSVSLIISEPLDGFLGDWIEVQENFFLEVSGGVSTLSPFEP